MGIKWNGGGALSWEVRLLPYPRIIINPNYKLSKTSQCTGKLYQIMATTKNQNQESAKNAKVQSRESIIKEGLRDGNKESKSISGALKIVGMFWGAGYQKAMGQVGISKKSELVPATIFGMVCDSLKSEGENGTICKVWVKVYDKNANGKIKKVQKHSVFHYELREIKSWTPNKLVELLDQSSKGGVMPELPSYLQTKESKKAVDTEKVAA